MTWEIIGWGIVGAILATAIAFVCWFIFMLFRGLIRELRKEYKINKEREV